jgi:acyl-homoserine-lactone acylase
MLMTCRGARRLAALVLSSTLIVACSDDDDDNNNRPPEPLPPEPEVTYTAQIIWTEFGIPHISGEDWGSLGYGAGYSYAQQNFCVVMKEYVRAAGESARYLGDDGDLDADFVYKLYNDDERIQRLIDEELPDYMVDALTGYAAGLNRYLAETGVDNLAEGEEGCRGAEWVREVDLLDTVRLVHKAILRGSAAPLIDFMTAVTGPEEGVQVAMTEAAVIRQLAALDPVQVAQAIDMPAPEQMGSNAYAVGADAAKGNAGILFGNPHFPWQGPERFSMFHLTLGDGSDYDVMGAALHGLPAPVIGFNRDVAWSHTVSTGRRFTLYELQLDSEDPLQYLYDGEMRGFDTRTVSAERIAGDGSVETVSYTFYLSHYGPVLDLGSVNGLLAGWPNALGTLITYRDGNLENLRGLDQWVRMGEAGDMEEFTEALRTIGIPWVNTIAAGRDGNAFYGDISVVPNIPPVQYDNCIRGPLQSQLTGFGLPTFDGSDSECEWQNEEGAPAGLFGYDSLPKLETREYAANANDSYWLSNPRQLLTGFSPIIGREEVEQSLRTRATFDMAEERLAGTDDLGDPLFDIDSIREMSYGARNHAAELVVDDVVAICRAVDDWSDYSDDTDGMNRACFVLSNWDTRHRINSIGGHVFWEFWQDVRGTSELWAVPFDATDPVNTPRQLNVDNPDVVEAVREALASAVDTLSAAGIALDSAWGNLQFDEKDGERIGIHGGPGAMMFSVIGSDLVDGEGYSNIRAGNSYIQSVTWDETDCPDAYAILTYSQSTDPESDHYADATRLYSQGDWIDMPYCLADQEAAELRRETISE